MTKDARLKRMETVARLAGYIQRHAEDSLDYLRDLPRMSAADKALVDDRVDEWVDALNRINNALANLPREEWLVRIERECSPAEARSIIDGEER